MKMNNRITIICFLIVIFGISISSLFVTDKEFSENENRVLSQKPDYNWEKIWNDTYEESYEDYISDQFIQRDKWIGLKTCLDRAMLKKEIHGVYLGKENYLINAHMPEEYCTESACANYDYVKKFVNQYKDKLDIKLMIVPTSQEILKDKLPAYADTANETEVIQQIYNEMDEENVVNVVKKLKEHDEEYIYYKTDHHWTSLGAYYAYVEYMENIGKTALLQSDYYMEKVTDSFYGTTSSKVNIQEAADTIYLYKYPDKRDNQVCIRYNESEDIRNSLYDATALNTKNKYDVFLGGNNAILEVKSNNKMENGGDRLLIIKDSYAHAFVPFLVPHFEEIDVIDLRYYRENIDTLIEEKSYTHILVLYNITNLATDGNLYKLNLSSQ